MRYWLKVFFDDALSLAHGLKCQFARPEKAKASSANVKNQFGIFSMASAALAFVSRLTSMADPWVH
jgi:hypothetical protein